MSEQHEIFLRRAKMELKRQYATLLVAANKLGFTDADWNEANNMADKMMKERAK